MAMVSRVDGLGVVCAYMRAGVKEGTFLAPECQVLTQEGLFVHPIPAPNDTIRINHHNNFCVSTHMASANVGVRTG